MNLAIRLACEPLRSRSFGSISGTYAGIGTSLNNPARILFVQNLTDVTLLFSFDGVNDHFILPSNGFLLLDVMGNKSIPGGAFYVGEGTRIYVKESSGAPTSGSACVTSFYGTEG